MKPEDVKPGMRVKHRVFGFGEVLAVQNDPCCPLVSIRFEQHGTCEFILTIAAPNMEPAPAEVEPTGHAAGVIAALLAFFTAAFNWRR